MDVLNSCRCCLQAAGDMDLTIPHTHLGRTEIYSDMLKNCFDLHLTLIGNGSCGICMTCVGRLRDASDFKLQVQRCQAELQSQLQGVSHVHYEDVVIKTEKVENHGSEDENASHEDSLVKSERSGGVETCNEDDISSRSDPLGGAADAGTEPAAAISRDETLGLSSHTSDVSDTGEAHSGDEAYTSDPSEQQEKHIDQQRYPCDLCDKDFVNKSALKRHQRVIHATKKMYTCDKCNKKFTDLNKHKCTYTDEEFGCDVCGKKYSNKGYLNIHKVSHKGEKPYKCEKCNRRFKRKCFLQQHEKTPCEENSYTCDVCNKQFKTKMLLKRHILIHNGVKPYGCKECNKQYSKKEDLIAHKRVHTGDKYSCEVCDKQYIIKKNLSRHKKITHTGQKYECTTCNKLFTNNNYLKFHHQRIHTGEELAKKRPYSCKYCSKQFISKPDLNRHARIHTGERPFACEACQKTFKQKSHLVTHIKTCMKHLKS
ncbi:zinc finger protein 436-like [Cydia amplana]|uniref:zinc finger protein 436-like n=1 Tax=Cydia amplana TaxID=1869771 RepID=UPI002FE551BD